MFLYSTSYGLWTSDRTLLWHCSLSIISIVTASKDTQTQKLKQFLQNSTVCWMHALTLRQKGETGELHMTEGVT